MPQSGLEKIVVMAGNPKISLGPDGAIELSPNLTAFRAALEFIEANRGQVSAIYTTFDHRGLFKGFLDSDQTLTSNQRGKPRLSHLDPKIRAPYEDLISRTGASLDLSEVRCITEEQCRTTMRGLAETLSLETDPAFYSTLPTGESACERDVCAIPSPGSGPIARPLRVEDAEDDEDEEITKAKITCKGITAAIIARCAKHGNDVRCFWEYHPVRGRPPVFAIGTELARKYLGVTAPVTHRVYVGESIPEHAQRFSTWTQRPEDGYKFLA